MHCHAKIEKWGIYSLNFSLMGHELCLIVCEEITLVAGLLVVHLEDMSGQAFGTGCFVVAHDANEGFSMSIKMTLEPPIVSSGPRTVAADISFVTLFLLCCLRSATVAASAVANLLALHGHLLFRHL